MEIKRINLRDKSQVLPEYLVEMQKSINPSCKNLNVLGDPVESDLNAIAVVGSRKITNYGRLACKDLVSRIAAAGVTIVSGLMYGADIEAHKAAIAVGGRTIAVLGYGIQNIGKYGYAKDVADEIISKKCGFIVSEYSDYENAKGWTFPARNRIVSGLSKAVIIIEAGIKSGSLITASEALDQGKTVFVVPGSIFNPVSKGSHFLIKSGATLLDDAGDVLDYLGISVEKRRLRNPLNLSESENKLEVSVLNLLKRELLPLDIEGICLGLGSNISETNIALTSLEIAMYIKKDRLGKWQVAV